MTENPSWNTWVWVVAMIIGVTTLILTIIGVLWKDTPRKYLLLMLVFWTLAPALWFSVEYFQIFLRLPLEKTTGVNFEHFKYGQDLATKFWAGVVALVSIRTLEGEKIWSARKGKTTQP